MVALAQRMRVSIDEPDDNEVQFLSLVVTARAYGATLAATNMDASRVMAVLSVPWSPERAPHGCGTPRPMVHTGTRQRARVPRLPYAALIRSTCGDFRDV